MPISGWKCIYIIKKKRKKIDHVVCWFYSSCHTQFQGLKFCQILYHKDRITNSGQPNASTHGARKYKWRHLGDIYALGYMLWFSKLV